METATTHKYVQFLGMPSAAVASGHLLVFVTAHPEDKPTPLYRLNLDGLNLDSGSGSSALLAKGGRCAVANEESIFIGGADGQLYLAGLKSGEPTPFGKPLEEAPSALTLVGNKIAVGVNHAVHIVDSKGKVSQTFDLKTRSPPWRQTQRAVGSS